MRQVKEISIKNQTCYFFGDMLNIKNFHLNLLKIDKKKYKDIDIYHIWHIMIKKFGDFENIHSVNPLYLLIHSATGYFKKRSDEKYLILDSTEKYGEVWSETRSEIKTLHSGKELFYEKKKKKNAKTGIHTFEQTTKFPNTDNNY